jgi:homoserine kinase
MPSLAARPRAAPRAPRAALGRRASATKTSTSTPPRAVSVSVARARGALHVARAGGTTKSTIAAHRWSTDVDAWVIEGSDCALEAGERLILSVPATSANMGPGFDCFGFAVDVRNELIVERGTFAIEIEGEGREELPRDETNAIYDAVRAGFEAARPGMKLPKDLRFTSVNRIPPARGLGSSSAALVSGLACGLALGGMDVDAPRTKQILLNLASDIEGHPDNVAPAIYGGFQISINDDNQWITQRVSCPKDVQTVLFIPKFQSLTAETRAQLSPTLPIADAVHNIARAGLLVNAFATGNLELLRYATQDVIHQPIRGKPFGLDGLIDAALKAGAQGCFMSGAGPTVLAVVGGHGGSVENDTAGTFKASMVADAMMAASRANNVDGEVVIASPTETGVTAFVEFA